MEMPPELTDACQTSASCNAVFLIADISGYTRFMMKNRSLAVHATLVVQRLLDAMAQQMRTPFDVEEVEGDALFCAATDEGPTPGNAPSSPGGWRLRGDTLMSMCDAVFEAFETERDTLAASSMCGCATCSAIGNLRLKIIVHTGTAVRYTVGRHAKLSGVDVVVVHRLLKNSVKCDEYVLFTASAFDDLELCDHIEVEVGAETLEGVGRVETRVHRRARAGEAAVREPAPFLARVKEKMRLLRGEIQNLLGRLPAIEFDES